MKRSSKILIISLIGTTLALIGCARGGLIDLIGTRDPNPICGSEEYNAYKQICYENTLYDYCCSDAYGCLNYDPATEGCSGGLVLQKCGSNLYNTTTHSCKSGTLMANSTFVDSRDNRKYKYVTIGDQVWMAENLRYGEKVYKIREPDGFVRGGYYDYIFGPLYKFDDARNACPKGWHLPTINEWKKLVDFAGGSKVAGKRLKAEKNWKKEHKETEDGIGRSKVITALYTVSGNGTDDYGFSAMPGGRLVRDNLLARSWEGSEGEWWSTSEELVHNRRQLISFRMKSESDNVEIDGIEMRDGVDHKSDYGYRVGTLRLSVRCIADESEVTP